MAKTFEVNILSSQSITQLKRELTKYKNSLNTKAKKIVKELTKIGLEVIDVKVGESPLGHHITVQVKSEDGGMVIVAQGETKFSDNYPPFNTLLAIEFGAGIHYNYSENPKAEEMGYGVGTFPGQTHAFQEEGWWFKDEETDKWIHSYGVQATMPMYNASIEMRQKVTEIAKEVFADA